jgi:hypothetical protein
VDGRPAREGFAVGVGDVAEAGEGVAVRAGLAQLSGPGARELSAVGLDQQAAQDLA